MGRILKSTQHTRPLLPDSFQFVRSDAPVDITEPEKVCIDG